LTRYKKGIFSSEARPQRVLKIAIPNTPSMGPAAGVLVWIDGTTGKIAAPLGQVHFLREATGEYRIVPKDDLEKFDWRSGGYSDRSLKIFCRDADEHREIVQLRGQIGIDFKPHSPIDDPSKRKLVERTVHWANVKRPMKIVFAGYSAA